MDARRLWCGSEPVALKPKVLDTLCYLASNPGRLLTKEELLKGIWPDRFVSEANLMQNISTLRRALGESETETKYIGTFQGRGYQFLVPVIEAAEPAAIVSVPAGKRFRKPALLAALAMAVAVTAFLAALRFRTPPPAIVHSTPFTRLPGSEYQPAISRDGSKVAFIWKKPGGEGTLVMVKGLEDDEPRQISGESGQYSSPSWSPDGRLLAYLHHNGTMLRMVVRPDHGGQEQVIAEFSPSRFGLGCRHLDWSPDGKLIAVDEKASATEPLALFLIDVATGHRTLLTRPAKGDIGDVAPRFSRDGKSISFIRMETWFHQDLYTVDLAGGKTVQKSFDRKQISDHDWSSDGSTVLVASNRGGEYRIWKLTSGGGKDAANWQPTPLSSLSTIQFSVAGKGGKVVYADLAQDLNVWKLELSPASLRTPKWSPVLTSTAADFLPQLSKDGKRICFLSDRSGEQQLWVGDAAGGNTRQLTRHGIRPFTGRWSPDGSKIIFHDVATMAIYVIDSAGGVPQIVGVPGTGNHPVFTTDGNGFFYTRASRVRLHNLKTGGETTLLEKPGYWKQPSADGKFLYYSGTLLDTFIKRLNITTGKCEGVVEDLLAAYWGAWAVGPAGIYYLAAGPQSSANAVIRYYDFATGRSSDLAPFPDPLPPVGTSTWSLSPDGRSLYVVRMDRSDADLTVVEPLL